MNSKYVGLGSSLGLCFGAAWGAALHILGVGSLGTNVGVGIALGVSLGTVFGATLGMAPHRPARRWHPIRPCAIRWVCERDDHPN